MNNKQLETRVNSIKILERLSENLGVDFITDGSNLKKIADVFTNEITAFSSEMDRAVSNSFIGTMQSNFLNAFGNERSLPRKVFNEIVLNKKQEVVEAYIDLSTSLLSEINEKTKLYTRGDILISNEYFIAETLEDVYIESLTQRVQLSLKISMQFEQTSYLIAEGETYASTPTYGTSVTLIPNMLVLFKRPVGLAMLVESADDYRMRLMEEEHRANNGANSLISSIVKEVPYLLYLEIDNYSEGHAIKTVYPYTRQLLEYGSDSYVQEMLVPLVNSSLQGRVLYGNKVRVKAPEPLMFNIKITFKKGSIVSESYLSNATITFNKTNTSIKNVDKTIIESNLKSVLSLYRENIESIKYIFTSTYVSEETFELGEEVFKLPQGRFMFLNNIEGEVSE